MPKGRGPQWMVLASVTLLAATASCASDAGLSAEADPSVAATDPSVIPTSSKAPATSPQASAAASESEAADAAPEELQGEWRTQSGEDILLTLEEDRYAILRGEGVGSGRISVRGNQIEFTRSGLCEGTGLYEWSIQDGMLTFVPVEPRDPCGNRIAVLENNLYVKEPAN